MKLWKKVIIGLFAGILFGYCLNPESAININKLLNLEGELAIDGKLFLTTYVKPFGTIFINLIKMVVIPLIFFSLIAGITNMTEPEAFKRVGAKAVTWFLTTGAFAVVIGLFFGEVFKPGIGVDLHQLREMAGPVAGHAVAESKSLGSILVDVVPTNVVKSMADDNILQVVVFAIFMGVTIVTLGDKAKLVRDVCQNAAQVIFRMIESVVQLSPYGVFALISYVVGTQGFDIVVALATLAAVVLGALLTQYILFGILLVLAARLSPWPFYRKVLETQSLAFSTSSSKATLSTAMRVANERLGVSKSSTSFVLPLGASINMDGTAIYLGICALFVSQAFNVPIDPHHYLILILTATLGSIGAAGIPSGSLLMMAMVFTSVGLPVEGIALIAGIDRILDMMRTTINITGDTLITLIVDKSEGTLDQAKYHDKTL